METLNHTPLYDMHVKYGGKLIDFAGWKLPVEYEGIKQEHLSVRQDAGLFDVSHMGEVTVKGIEAEAFLNHLLTNNILTLQDNGVMYTLMCYEDGGVVDDLLVYKHNTESYLLVINASNIDKDFDWIKKQGKQYNVLIQNISEEIAEVAIQGPKAEEILQKLTETKLEKIRFFKFNKNVLIGNYKCLVSRTGYTGEDGFEIYTSPENIGEVWELLMNAGLDIGLKPAGLGCRDTLRFEVALPLYGNEITKDITPLEAGLGFFVKLNKKNFIGLKALRKQKDEGLDKKLIGFELEGKKIARQGYEILNSEGELIGEVTTGYNSPSVTKSVGHGIIKTEYTKLGTEVLIQIRKNQVKAKVVKKKFYNKNYKTGGNKK